MYTVLCVYTHNNITCFKGSTSFPEIYSVKHMPWNTLSLLILRHHSLCFVHEPRHGSKGALKLYTVYIMHLESIWKQLLTIFDSFPTPNFNHCSQANCNHTQKRIITPARFKMIPSMKHFNTAFLTLNPCVHHETHRTLL